MASFDLKSDSNAYKACIDMPLLDGLTLPDTQKRNIPLAKQVNIAIVKEIINNQLSFFFMEHQFKRLVPKNRYDLLNREVIEFLWQDQALFNMARRLHTEQKIDYLGELVTMSREELLPYARNKESYIDRLEERLQEIGLGLNSRLFRWSRPDAEIIGR